MTPTFSPQIQERLERGREAFRRQAFAVALEHDEEALVIARETEDRHAQAVCHRFVGLCHYRLASADSLARSEEHFREAIKLCVALSETRLRLIVSNHLGATLRDLGRHDEGYDLFREALRDAVGPDLVEVRARLLGNLGALLDELRQRAGADDCYARYEELLERSEDTRRLANARGLAGRAALLRGDVEEATWRFEDELRRGTANDDLPRCSAARRHLAHLAMVRVERAKGATPETIEGLAKDAESAFDAALTSARESGDLKDQIRVGVRHVEFLRSRGRIAEAHAALTTVRALSDELDHPVLRPKVDQTSARVCADAGLHGEALWYLSRAARRRIDVIRALKNARVREMARAWLDEVRAMADELHDEAFRVPRGDAERDQFKGLIEEINQALGDTHRTDSPKPMDDAWRWHDQLRTRSRERWATILGSDFERLHEDSQVDLVRADVTYHGAVDDLGRSAHLLALTLERELRERLLQPFREVVRTFPDELRERPEWEQIHDGDRQPSLGTLLRMVAQAEALNVRARFEAVFDRRSLDVLAPIVGLARGVSSVLGTRFDIATVRNDVAHGRPLTALDRVAVDTIKRALTLDAPIVLKGLLTWPLHG
ncbi:MAG: hypothetical protein U0326_24065 [Polyangiales bacterium]